MRLDIKGASRCHSRVNGGLDDRLSLGHDDDKLRAGLPVSIIAVVTIRSAAAVTVGASRTVGHQSWRADRTMVPRDHVVTHK
jgi:hypothetical protein